MADRVFLLGGRKGATVRGYLLCAMALAYATGCHAAMERHTESPRALAMGGAGSAFIADVWGALANPSALARVRTSTVAFSYAPNPYGLQELKRGALTLVQPVPSAAVAVAGVMFGFELYRELSLGLACGIQWTHSLRIGFALTYYGLAIRGYGSDAAVGADVGMTWDLTAELHLGCTATNVNGPVLGEQREKLPQSFTVALGYLPSDDVLLAMDLVKDVGLPAELRAGIEYTILNVLSLRIGTSRQPSSWSAGCGIHLPAIDFDYAFSCHDQLGWLHRLGISLSLGMW